MNIFQRCWSAIKGWLTDPEPDDLALWKIWDEMEEPERTRLMKEYLERLTEESKNEPS